MGLKEEKAFLILACVTPVNSFRSCICVGRGAEKSGKPSAAAGSIKKDDLSVKTDLVIELGKIAVTL